jgi:hypothetical protein
MVDPASGTGTPDKHGKLLLFYHTGNEKIRRACAKSDRNARKKRALLAKAVLSAASPLWLLPGTGFFETVFFQTASLIPCS